MRVVLDTSVWVSALLWLGLPHRLLELAETGALTLVMSPVLVEELRGVLARPKFASALATRSANVVELIQGVLAYVELYSAPALTGVVPADPDDDAVIACGLAAQAQWIVSGDEHLLSLGSYEGIRIGTPRQFLEAEFPQYL